MWLALEECDGEFCDFAAQEVVGSLEAGWWSGPWINMEVSRKDVRSHTQSRDDLWRKSLMSDDGTLVDTNT